MITVVVAVAALAVAFLHEPFAHAQGEDNNYVDVDLILESPSLQAVPERKLNIIVMNHGSRTAYDVEVVVNVVYPENSSHFKAAPKVPVGSASLENDGTSLRWAIPALGGLQRVEISTEVTHESSSPPIFDHAEKAHEFFGKVTTSSFESDLHERNNTERVWSSTNSMNPFAAVQAKGDYSVNVSVDEHNPPSGSIVNFKITAIHYSDTPFSVIDQKVDIELTNGLAVDDTSTISYDPATRASSVIYSNGVFNIGTLKFSDKKPRHSVILPIRVANNATVNEQCLTATITGDPPPGVGPFNDDISDNVVKVCLGEQVPLYSTSPLTISRNSSAILA